jgi:Fe-S-cluster-containing hydrogenase component 2
MALLTEGCLDLTELRALPGVPSDERMEAGAVAVIECAQEIPCNPCEELCPYGAIEVGQPITNLPVLNEEQCIGCGLCIAGCPGEAIFVVDKTHSTENATVQLPYEFLPLPAKGQIVDGIGRVGQWVCEALVVRVQNPKKNDRTPVVTIEVRRDCAMEVRDIRLKASQPGCAREVSGALRSEKDGNEEDLIVCRCEEVTKSEILQAIREGARTPSEVKRRTRAGMGLCQGTTCRTLISSMLAEETGRSVADVRIATYRPPVRPVELGALASLRADNDS